MRQGLPLPLESPPLAILYERYAPFILDYARKHVSSWEDAEDILVEVFVAALENPALFALTEHQQGAWLWGVTRHKVADSYRRQYRHPQVPLDLFPQLDLEDEAATPEARSLQQEEARQLQRFLQQLSPMQQEILRLRFSVNLRCSQIASRLGKPEGTVRSLLSRTLNHLRSLYKQVEGR